MSLKAKIEAVIYASEEPVTLAQLVGLLGQEAQAELDQMDAAQQSLDLEPDDDGSADVDGLNSEVMGDEATPSEDAVSDSEQADDTAANEAAAAESAAVDTAVEPVVSETVVAEPVIAEAEATADDAEKKAAREAKDEKDKARRLREYFRSLLEQLIADYANGDRGLEIREVASGYRLSTKPEYHDAVRGFVKSLKPPLKLSLQALETLAVVAYKQPVTAPEVSEIRGVDSGGVLGSLMTRKLVTTAGRKQVIGRPILYKTTKDFLLRFGLKDINELPSMEEFEKMAGELAEQEEIPMEHGEQASGETVVDARTNGESAVSAEYAADQPEHQVVEMADDSEALPEHHAPETADELEAERHTHLPQADGSPDTVDDPLDDQLGAAGFNEPPAEGVDAAEAVETAEGTEENEPVGSKLD